MKRLISIFLTAFMAVSLAACSAGRSSVSNTDNVREEGQREDEENIANEDMAASTEASEEASENGPVSSRILVAYVPMEVQEGQTEDAVTEAARLIAETAGGTLYEISGDSESDPVENFASYETVLLGVESSDGSLPSSAETFLQDYDFGAKVVLPFAVEEDGGESDGTAELISQIAEAVSQLQPGALVQSSGLVLSADRIREQASEITDWVQSLSLNSEESLPDAGMESTVADAKVDARSRQTFYLWEEGNMPSVTEYTVNNGNYADDPDFRPMVRTFPVPEGTAAKGAVLICAGGAFQFRSDQYEGTPVAEALSELGYQSFVVDYRLRPYTQEEGALDLARAVRFVRSHAAEYGIEEEDIAVMGFSAGGILSGEMLLNYDETVNGTALDDSYVPDELVQVSADAAACGMIYSFYGRLSVASTDVEKFRASGLPPTYFAYGTRDPFVREFEECIAALQEAGVPVESHVLEGMPHGFGAQGGWIPEYDAWLENVFAG